MSIQFAEILVIDVCKDSAALNWYLLGAVARRPEMPLHILALLL